ncbi:MAG: agmatine deiminase family protein [Chitinophagaceae bacterium]
MMNSTIPKSGPVPVQDGFYFPAEWSPHQATWLSWPHKEASWPGKIGSIFPIYSQFIQILSLGEQVCILVQDKGMESFALSFLEQAKANLENIRFFHFPTNDAWCRDHGPAFLVSSGIHPQKAIVDWGYNAWGNKYPPFDLDDQIPTHIGKELQLPVYYPGIIMEGGSVDFNGKGTLLTTKSCLLHPNRNPDLSQADIENYLKNYYGVSQILWLGDGILGDDTDGHIDDLTRFVREDTVVTVVEENKGDGNFIPLQQNLKALKEMRLINDKPLQIIELPMPKALFYEGTRLPASYANFYIANKSVIVPTFRDKNDQRALDILQDCFPDRLVIGLDSTDLIWGLGSFHCLSQQEPAL